MKRLISSILLIAVAFVISGCATTPDGSYEDDSSVYIKRSVATRLRYDDLPVPSNFTLDASKSLAVENQTTRISSLHYKGRAERIEIINFYKDNMESYGWHLINLIEGVQTILNYTNGDEICTILMTGSGSDMRLNISLSPESSKSE